MFPLTKSCVKGNLPTRSADEQKLAAGNELDTSRVVAELHVLSFNRIPLQVVKSHPAAPVCHNEHFRRRPKCIPKEQKCKNRKINSVICSKPPIFPLLPAIPPSVQVVNVSNIERACQSEVNSDWLAVFCRCPSRLWLVGIVSPTKAARIRDLNPFYTSCWETAVSRCTRPSNDHWQDPHPRIFFWHKLMFFRRCEVCLQVTSSHDTHSICHYFEQKSMRLVDIGPSLDAGFLLLNLGYSHEY